jgi:hypothetical protein
VVAIGIVARTTVALPRASTAELRAVTCCLAHCPDMPRPPMTPKRCCFVGSDAGDPASTAQGPSLERPSPSLLAILGPAPATGARICGPARRDLASLRAGPPGFPDTLKLRC